MSGTRTRFDPELWLAAGFGAGFAPRAPGTVGSLVALPIYALLRLLPPVGYLLAVAAMFVLGVWICGRVARRLGDPDPGLIVWDEIVGMQVALFMAPASIGYVVLGFALFRLFDIVKPFPIAQSQALPGGYGVVVDDVLAGIYAALVLQGVVWILK